MQEQREMEEISEFGSNVLRMTVIPEKFILTVGT